mmetsp:Transcript_40962/g.70049  ORF Transcript_40962/g.70049 Transcript_40962/m.70049 type:complete len:210 (-) Transcript_40962:419-1048(-)
MMESIHPVLDRRTFRLKLPSLAARECQGRKPARTRVAAAAALQKLWQHHQVRMVRWIPFPTRLRRLREEALPWDKTMELPVKRKRKRNSSHSSSRGVLHLEWDSSLCSSRSSNNNRNNPVDSTPDNNSRASSHSRKLDNCHGVQPNQSNLRLGINPSSSSNSSMERREREMAMIMMMMMALMAIIVALMTVQTTKILLLPRRCCLLLLP